MKGEWTRIVPQIIENPVKINYIKCPSCGKYEMDYIYIGDDNTRIGFLQIWCNKCLKGTYVSRTVAPPNAKFAEFESHLKSIVPKFELV